MAETAKRAKMEISDEVAIEINQMNKWYGTFHVLRDINMVVNRGERIVVCGLEQIEKRAVPDIPAEQSRHPRARQAEARAAGFAAIENERIGQKTGDAGGLDLEPPRRHAQGTNFVPICIEGMTDLVLHLIRPCGSQLCWWGMPAPDTGREISTFHAIRGCRTWLGGSARSFIVYVRTR